MLKLMHSRRRSTDRIRRSLRGVCVVAAGLTVVMGNAGPSMALARGTVTHHGVTTTATSPALTAALRATPALRATANQPGATHPGVNQPGAIYPGVTEPGATRAYPATTAPAATLFGVSALSASDAWAVGYSVTASGGQSALIKHWNGHTWTTAVPLSPTSTSRA